VSIAALAVWAFTVAAGAYLLTHVIAAKRADRERPAPRPAQPVPTAASAAAPAAPRLGAPRPGAPPGAPRPGAPPPIPRTKVTAGPGDHPLREFSHPALAAIGLACWLAFTGTHDLAFAWPACGALAVTAGIGLGWLTGNIRAARGRGQAGAGVPGHLIAVHGIAAATTVILVVLTVVTAAHG
jgi:hypothetical protein